MSKDAKIGLFAVLLFLGFLLFNSFRDSGLITFHDRVKLLFTQVHGLRAGDPVTIGGVPAGRVENIDFAPREIQESFVPVTGGAKLVRAVVDLGGRKLPKESTYAIRIDLNGRRWLDITISPSEESIGPEEHFFAEVDLGMDDQMQRTITTFTTLAKQTEELRDELTAPEFLLRTKDTASNLRFYSREMVSASAKAPAQLKKMQQSLDVQELAILQQIEAYDKKGQELSRRMRELGPQLSESMNGWSSRIELQGERLTSTLQMASQRTLEYQRLLDEAIETKLDPEVTKRLLKQGKRWSKKLKEYRFLAEDLHALSSDPAIRDDLKKIIQKVRVRSDELVERVDSLEKRLEKDVKKIPGLKIKDS